MSSGYVRVDTDGVRKAASGFEAEGGEAGAFVNGLVGRINALGEPWGDDKNGQKFAAEYIPARDEILAALGTVRDALVRTGEDLRVMADNYDEVEQANTDIVTKGPDGTGA